MHLHDAEADRQPEPRAAPLVLRRVERLEDACPVLGRNTPARFVSVSMSVTFLKAGESDGMCRSRRLLLPRITMRGLLISWATLAASSPMAASFADSSRLSCVRWSSFMRDWRS